MSVPKGSREEGAPGVGELFREAVTSIGSFLATPFRRGDANRNVTDVRYPATSALVDGNAAAGSSSLESGGGSLVSEVTYRGGKSARGTAVVIGCGIAGAACARYLSVCGFRVVVLESRGGSDGSGGDVNIEINTSASSVTVASGNAIGGGGGAACGPQTAQELVSHPLFRSLGGRIRTERSANGSDPVELGASWVHGATRANPAAQLAREAKAGLRRSDWLSVQAVTGDGETRGPKHARSLERRAGALMDAVDRARRRLRKRGKNNNKGKGKDKGNDNDNDNDNADVALSEVIAGCRALFDGTDAELAHAVHLLVEQDYGAEASRLSALHFDQDEEFAEGGDPDCAVLGGYDRLVAHLLAPEPWCGMGPDGTDPAPIEIRKGCAVRSVSTLRDTVRVSLGGSDVEGDFCVCTVPLGVLQSGAIEFAPRLSARKTAAIGRIGFGLMNKVILRFARPHWPRDVEFFTVERAADGDGDGGERDTRDIFRLFMNMVPVTGQPILVAICAGEDAERLERLTDEQATRAAHGAVSRVLCGAATPRLPKPTSSRVTRWRADPHTRGAFSYLPPGSQPDDYVAMGESEGRLRFAGEACSRAFPNTVHGAYLSGIAAARDIVLDAGAGIAPGVDSMPGTVATAAGWATAARNDDEDDDDEVEDDDDRDDGNDDDDDDGDSLGI